MADRVKKFLESCDELIKEGSHTMLLELYLFKIKIVCNLVFFN